MLKKRYRIKDQGKIEWLADKYCTNDYKRFTVFFFLLLLFCLRISGRKTLFIPMFKRSDGP